MSITYPVTLPATIRASRFGLNINMSRYSGEFIRNRIAQSHGAGTTDRWEGVFTTPVLSPTQHREMSAWLTAMSVDDGTFYAYNPDHRTPTGVISGAPVVDGAGQTGTVINIKSLSLSTTNILKAGDYIGIGSQFFEVKKNVDSDGAGLAAVDILPAIRTAPADLATVTYSNPTMIAQLVDTDHMQETDHNSTGVISFAWQEKI